MARPQWRYLGHWHWRKTARDWREKTNTPADLLCMIGRSDAMPTRTRGAVRKTFNTTWLAIAALLHRMLPLDRKHPGPHLS
jgi:hypothetical protein